MKQTVSLENRISAFVELGQVLGLAANSFISEKPDFSKKYPFFHSALQQVSLYNPWFTPANIAFALHEWEMTLSEKRIRAWLDEYKSAIQFIEPKRVVVIMAGNIPLVGFHDFLCVLMSGNNFIGKLSSDDKVLLPAIAEVLFGIEPGFKENIQFTESTIKDFDAIIATGSNNSARYFEYYFSKYPHIIRKNRNGVAVLGGNESDETLRKLGPDICTYFGLGCRNVSKIFIPVGFDPKRLFVAIEPFITTLSDHYKYMNNYSYQRSILLLNNTQHLDNGVFIVTESEKYASPIPVLYYQFYENIEALKSKLTYDDKQIQCIATDVFTNTKTVHIGCTQSPGLADYADGVDTMDFLARL
ncbi:MAG: acyl-CoA reductase [Bacteroidales bacterium]